MTQSHSPFTPDFGMFSSGGIVITPNQRIAAWLQVVSDEYHQTHSVGDTWHSPKILSLTAWIEEIFQDAQDSACLQPERLARSDLSRLGYQVLSPLQEKAVWDEVIVDESHAWIRPDGAAKQAQQAWSIVNRWDVVEANATHNTNENTRLFLGWLDAFKQRCDEQRWMSRSEREALIALCVQHDLIVVDDSLYFYGFADLEPSMRRLCDQIVDKGGKVELVPFGEETADVSCRPYPDRNAELEAALTWLVHSSACKPAGRFCVVAPDIADDRSKIERICKRLVQKETCTHPVLNVWRDRINVSAGSPLGSFGIVADAMLLLQACARPLTRGDWGVLIRSPYWSDHYVSYARCAQFSDVIAESKAERLTASAVSDAYRQWSRQEGAFDSFEDDPIGCLLTRLSLAEMDKKDRCVVWPGMFTRQLASLGWPGLKTLSSQDYQLREKFVEQIDLLKAYDDIVGSVSFGDMYSRLHTTLKETMFQIQTDQASMQVLGVLEASAMTFEGIWVLSSDDKHWPESPAPNPFLCQSFQREMAMPNASADKELRYAEFILGSFKKNANEVIFSWHEMEGDTELGLSPVLQAHPIIDGDENGEGGKAVSDHLNPFDIPLVDSRVPFTDDQGPAIPKGTKIKGGASIIKNQAACPFRAFALYRLGARAIEEKEDGLSPAERGDLLHVTLEHFWQQCTSLSQLLGLLEDDAELACLIEACVAASLAQFTQANPGVNDAFLALESRRLFGLVHYWLSDIEAKRSDFDVVSVEQSETMLLGNIEVSVKADRIDRIEGDYTVIVDYKTGLKSKSAWEGERPDDPQLPLYAVNHKDEVDGLLFGIVRKGEAAFKGEMDEAVSLLDNKKSRSVAAIDDWPVHVEQWETVLTALADDFANGIAIVDPKNKKSCEFCELTTFCRRKEK